jgi:hypothetical protein
MMKLQDHLLLMYDVLIDSFNVKKLLVLREGVHFLHAEHLLQYLLSGVEEDVLVPVTEVQGFRQNAEEFRLLEADTEPLVHDELV